MGINSHAIDDKYNYTREITRGSVMCHYLMTNELICDQINTWYNRVYSMVDYSMVDLSLSKSKSQVFHESQLPLKLLAQV